MITFKVKVFANKSKVFAKKSSKAIAYPFIKLSFAITINIITASSSTVIAYIIFIEVLNFITKIIIDFINFIN